MTGGEKESGKNGKVATRLSTLRQRCLTPGSLAQTGHIANT